MKTQLDISIPVTIFKEGSAFIAYSPVLDLSTSAKTYAKVKERFNEVVELFFEEIVESGTLDEVLGNLGWMKTQSSWMPPLPVGHEMATVGVPFVH